MSAPADWIAGASPTSNPATSVTSANRKTRGPQISVARGSRSGTSRTSRSRPTGSPEGQRRRQQRQHPTLDQHTRHYARAGCAERPLNGDFALALHRAHEQEVRDVRDGNEHHADDAGHQEEERGPDAGDEVRGKRPHARRPSERPVVVRMLAREPPAQASTRARHVGRSRRQPTDGRCHEARAVARRGKVKPSSRPAPIPRRRFRA